MGTPRLRATNDCLSPLTTQITQWKKYLTTMQITQFVIDLFAVYFGSECD
jgi:hypothetical protein